MPLVRISVEQGTSPSQRKVIADEVYRAMRETINVPDGDRFIIVSLRGSDELFVDPHFIGMQRTERFVLIQIFLGAGRTQEQKQALYARIANRLHERLGISLDDVMTVLSESHAIDWSFGKGQAQFASLPPSWLEGTPLTTPNES